jgi:hypothetical protein
MVARRNAASASDLPAEQLEAIGRIAFEWSYLESIMDAAIAKLAYIESDDVALAITTKLQSHARLAMLTTLFAIECEQELAAGASKRSVNARQDQFSSIHKSVDKLRERRNEFLHARWVIGSHGSPFVVTVKARKSLTRDLRGWRAAEIRAVAEAIAAQSRQLCAFFGIAEEYE